MQLDMLTVSDFRQRVFSNVGSPEKIEYRAEVDKNGVLNLVENGKTDLYSYIQSFRDSVDINVLLQRYQNGETDVLSRVQGAFGDFTDMPRTYAELLNRVIVGEQEFDKLPVDVKAKFNHSFSEFLATAGRPEWYEKLGAPVQNIAPASDEVPVESEEKAE